MLCSTLRPFAASRSITRSFLTRSFPNRPSAVPATFARPIAIVAASTSPLVRNHLPSLPLRTAAMSSGITTTATPSSPSMVDTSYTPEERFFPLRNGMVLRARHWKSGPSDVPVRDCRRFLAFHGFLDNAGSFDPLSPLLLKQLGPEPVEIVALDLAGHGQSSHRTTEDYALWRYVEDIDQVAEQLGWQRHAVLGHSMGGAVATLYSGLYESRVTLCILLDNFGPFTRSVEDQPQHLLEHIQDKKKLVTKRLPFHPTIESACTARSQGGANGIQPEYARFLMDRGLKPAEKTMEDGTVVQGWTWTTDRILTIRSAQSMSEEYSRAFMRRICCPVLGVLAEGGLLQLTEMVNERTGWIDKAKTTIKGVPGSHSVHMEDAPRISELISSWVLEQDIALSAKL